MANVGRRFADEKVPSAEFFSVKQSPFHWGFETFADVDENGS
jgi:hypothetical protein